MHGNVLRVEKRDGERQRKKERENGCASTGIGGVTRERKGSGREREVPDGGRVGGICSLLPGDRVHRLLAVDAPKSRIFEKQPGEPSRRDSLFHRKLPRPEGNRKNKESPRSRHPDPQKRPCRFFNGIHTPHFRFAVSWTVTLLSHGKLESLSFPVTSLNPIFFLNWTKQRSVQ